MHVVVAINPTSAFGKHGGVGEQVVQALRAAGHEAVSLLCDSFEALRLEVEIALSRGADALVVVGGDGMVSLGVNAVAESKVPLGIVTAGTGNDMARGLALPYTSPAESLAQLLELMKGQPRVIDLAKVTTDGGVIRWFGCVLSAGFDAIVNERANRMTFPNGPSKYIWAVLLELVRLRPRQYRLTVDGESRDVEAVLIAVGNNTSLGGGMILTPNAKLDDGLLDVVIGHTMSRLSLLRLFPKVFRGAHIGHRLVEELRGKVIRIETPGVIAYADGERVGALPIDVTVVPGALRVYAPTT